MSRAESTAERQSVGIATNIFPAVFQGDKIDGFDCYKVEGVTSDRFRYKQLGDAIQGVWEAEHRSFASYTPSKGENFIVGYLGKPPTKQSFSTANLTISYLGKISIPLGGAGRRTITELLNKTKRAELRKVLWSAGAHFFYPKEGRKLDLDQRYNGCNLILFRGPFFRYNVLRDGRMILSLDSSTHYVRADSFLQEIKKGLLSLDWINQESDRLRREASAQRKRFSGIHFFYTLFQNDAVIDGVDLRPISQIPISPPQIVNGVECRTISQYLRAKYRNNPLVAKLDESQPGLVSGNITFAPQFLHRTIHNKEIPYYIQNQETFHMDTDSPKQFRDVQMPAKVRARLISEYFLQYNFKFVDLGPVQFKMGEYLTFPITNHFEKPKLLIGSDTPVQVNEIESQLARGLRRPPDIREICFYSLAPRDFTSSFYDLIRKFTMDSYAVSLPERYIPLETDYAKMKNQLGKTISSRGGSSGLACLALIPKKSGYHHQLTNIFGEFRIPSKFFTIPVAEKILFERKISFLGSPIASFLSRAGAIPWVLHDRLHYGCYIAVDIGRSMSEQWAMSVVFNNTGEFTIKQGGPLVGEDLDEQGIGLCITEASNYAPNSDTLVYLRDGEVYDSERNAIENAVEKSGYKNVAAVSVKETVPYRIFRKNREELLKPLSGDFCFLDANTVILCAAGVDEYKQGMPKPIVAEIDVVKGELSNRDIVEDMFKLSYLNWGSPGRSYATPAPIRLAHKAARELGLGIRRFGPPF